MTPHGYWQWTDQQRFEWNQDQARDAMDRHATGFCGGVHRKCGFCIAQANARENPSGPPPAWLRDHNRRIDALQRCPPARPLSGERARKALATATPIEVARGIWLSPSWSEEFTALVAEAVETLANDPAAVRAVLDGPPGDDRVRAAAEAVIAFA